MKSSWRERFGVYFLGVAIGLMLVGALFWIRAQMARGGQPPPAGQTSPP